MKYIKTSIRWQLNTKQYRRWYCLLVYNCFSI